MKFVTLASLATAVNSQEQILATSSTGALNFHWTEDMHCPGAFDDSETIETLYFGEGTKTFEEYAQECAELAYGLSAEYAPCIEVGYFAGGVSFELDDGTRDSSNSLYYCNALLGDSLVHKDDL